MESEIVKIQFSNGQIGIFDYCDLPILAKFKWYPVKKHNCWYIYANTENSTTTFHKEKMRPPKGMEVDHIDGNGLDNRELNLRISSHMMNQNNFTRPVENGSKSQYRYVNWCNTRQQWRVQITFNNKTKTIGSFSNEIEAATAANNYILKNNLPKKLNDIESKRII